MKTFQEFLAGLKEEACTTSSIGDATSDGTTKPKAKKILKRKPEEKLEEKLSSTDPVSKWIEDFQSSTNPKFDGKTKEERRKMAIAAFYSSKKE